MRFHFPILLLAILVPLLATPAVSDAKGNRDARFTRLARQAMHISPSAKTLRKLGAAAIHQPAYARDARGEELRGVVTQRRAELARAKADARAIRQVLRSSPTTSPGPESKTRLANVELARIRVKAAETELGGHVREWDLFD